jgi:enoyl-CoA hydratase/carnithine racemase
VREAERFEPDVGLGLGAGLELDLTEDGAPANPLVVLDLERWRGAGDAEIGRAAGLVAAALPITVGVLRGPLTPGLASLAAAASLTLTDGPTSVAGLDDAGLASYLVPVGDVEGTAPGKAPGTAPGTAPADLEAAVARLRDAVSRSPRAAVTCGQLVRQTAVLAAGQGLAAEAAAYSLLLGGPEFARWLRERERGRRSAGPGGPARPRSGNQPAEPVLVRRDAGRLSIVLNVPERRNAFSAAVREALLDAVLLAEADPTIESVELAGAGPAFCSGGDLDEFGTATDLVAACLVRLSRAPWRVIERIAPKVTVFAHGACVGAGAEIAAYAGRVVAAPDAFFALPEVGMGLVPGAGGSVSVVRRIGRWRAAWLMLTGDRLPAATALRWGLVDEIKPREQR